MKSPFSGNLVWILISFQMLFQADVNAQKLSLGIKADYLVSINTKYGQEAAGEYYFGNGKILTFQNQPIVKSGEYLPNTIRLNFLVEYEFRNRWFINAAISTPFVEQIGSYNLESEGFTHEMNYSMWYISPSILAGAYINPKNLFRVSIFGGLSSKIVTNYIFSSSADGISDTSENWNEPEKWIANTYMNGFKNNTYYAKLGVGLHFYNFSLSSSMERSVGALDNYNNERYSSHNTVWVSLDVKFLSFNFEK